MTAEKKKKELPESINRAMMSLVRTVESLEEDGVLKTKDGASVAVWIVPEILSYAASRCLRQGEDEGAVLDTVMELVYIRNAEVLKAFIGGIFERAEYYTEAPGEQPGGYAILKSFDESILKKDADFYKRRGGNTGLSEMYMQIVGAVVSLMRSHSQES